MGFLSTIQSRLGSAFSSARPVGSGGGWTSLVVRESYPGAWQKNEEIGFDTALSNPTVFRCVSLIASDIGKCRLRLVALTAAGIWNETTSPAFSPVLRVPNRYQTMNLFLESWMLSKLLQGNTYILKERDDRHVVKAMYVLDPAKVTPLVAPDGAVYYEIRRDDLAGVPEETAMTVPASEVIHDRWNCAFHPLVGLSPLYACGGAALEALKIQSHSTAYFASGGRPNGILLTPVELDQLAADRLSEKWHSLGPGRTAIGYNLKFQDIKSPTAVDSQLTEQLDWTAKTIAGTYGVPISMVDSSIQPPYANSEAAQLQYHSQCLQTHMTGIETALDAGLELPTPYGTEFDIDDLIWMDTATKTKAAHDAQGALSPNEIRFKYFGVGPVAGGHTPYLQQQMYSLEALAARDAAAPPPATPALAPPAGEPTDEAIAAAVGDLAKG